MNKKIEEFGNLTDMVVSSYQREKEHSEFTFVGEVFDKITHKDGTVELREKSFNIVVDSVSRLIAALIKNQTGYNTGSLFWAFGEGQATWDTQGYTPIATTTRLVNEIFRKTISSRNFIDSNGASTTTVTNRLQLDISLGTTEANGRSLREFGIFGGNATSTANSGVMVNHKSHARIDKEEGMQVDRSVRFTF